MNLTQGVTSVTPVGLSFTRALVLRECLCCEVDHAFHPSVTLANQNLPNCTSQVAGSLGLSK